ncbi:MAG: hypothetical protein CM15mV127_370 [Caudoviricetes sp.]|nr:MAG: hypothetical protein CM15mV127_370 [Caudoviricetes sp.]
MVLAQYNGPGMAVEVIDTGRGRTRLLMAKVTAYIPEPAPEYEAENQRQIIEALATMQQQLNFSFQQDLKNEQEAFNYFLA